MKLFVPACGDRLVLSKPWTFRLFLERRNMKYAQTREFYTGDSTWRGVFNKGTHQYRSVEVTLPVGTVLECDRVYIRTFNKSRVQEGDDYDSITWKLIDVKKDKMVKFGRFWVKLTDANQIEFELEADSRYRDRVKALKEVMDS